MKLIICEKPDLARKVVAAIGEAQRKDGYYINSEYIVTWCFGHLFELYNVEDYIDGNVSKWSMDILPFCPDKFMYCLKRDKTGNAIESIKKQYNIINSLVNSKDVTEIIHCGDADREGEVIIRLVLNEALKEKKEIKRLWLPEQTEKTIRNSLNHLEADSNYNNLFEEGICRMYIDWLYGINYTRYASIKAGSILRVGRVLIAIVKAIYDRDKLIKEFVPEDYIGLVSETNIKNIPVRLSSQQKYSINEMDLATQTCNRMNKSKGTVINVQRKNVKKGAGKLYSQSKLQNVCGKAYKLSPDRVLESVQSLYEKGYCTYPRTNTEYLAENERDKVRDVIKSLNRAGYDPIMKDNSVVFNDKKIESHSAIIPTYKIPDLDSLEDIDRKVYQAILNRFLCVFCPEDLIVDKTEIQIKCQDEIFSLNGEIILSKGYLKYEQNEKNNVELPKLCEGDIVDVDFKPVKKQTVAPKHYTVETLNNYLMNPFRKRTDTEDEIYKSMFEGVTIGTDATRAVIIKNAISNNYINLDNNTYTIMPTGIYVIELLERLKVDITAEKTVDLNKILIKVRENKISIEQAIAFSKEDIERAFSLRNTSVEKLMIKESTGKCPKCQGEIFENDKSFYCSNYKDGCKFSIWKNNKFFEACGIKVDSKVVSGLLKGRALVKLKKKDGSGTYSAYVISDFSEEYPKFQIKYKKKTKKK